MSNPLELMYGWQALLCAAAAFGVTKAVKTILDVALGKENRKANKWLTKVVLPTVPVVLGALYALGVPLRPEVLIEYVEVNLSGVWVYLGYMGWGAACGQFSTMLHGKLTHFLEKQPPTS